MLRVGVVLSLALCLGAAACGPSEPEPPPGARRLTEAEKAKIVPREHFAVPPEERPILGKIGDTTCATTENDLLVETNDRACLSLLKDTIKIDTSVGDSEVRLARLRVALMQPGPLHEGETVGWVLYATRVNCYAEMVVVLGNVSYRPDGVEISRATPAGGPLPLPDGLTAAKLREGVCSVDLG